MVIKPRKGVLDKNLILGGAEQKTDRWVVARSHYVGSVPAHVGIKLTKVFVAERIYLQFDQDMALEDAVVEDQVHETVRVANEDALLAGFETEPVSKFEQKSLQSVEQRLLDI